MPSNSVVVVVLVVVSSEKESLPPGEETLPESMPLPGIERGLVRRG